VSLPDAKLQVKGTTNLNQMKILLISGKPMLQMRNGGLSKKKYFAQQR
jgi:hypothetical protein